MGAWRESTVASMAELRPATLDDFDAAFDVLDAQSRAAFGSSEVEREHVRRGFELPATDRWVTVDEGRITGYATLDEAHELTLATRDPHVADALLARAEARARERGFDRIEVIAVREDAPLYELVQRGGFTLEREIQRMWRPLNGDLPEPQWADGVTMRTYTDADGERVHQLLDELYAGWDPEYVARSHDGWLTFMTQHDEFDPSLWFLVERDGELVACALHWKEHQRRGWVKDIVVRESERGRGIAKALLQHAFRTYAARDVESVGLKVDSNNPTSALQLYERTGFVTDRRYGIWAKRL